MRVSNKIVDLKRSKSFMDAVIFYIASAILLYIISSLVIIIIGIVTQNFSIDAAYTVSVITIFTLQFIFAYSILKAKKLNQDYILIVIAISSGIASVLVGIFIGNILVAYLTTLKSKHA